VRMGVYLSTPKTEKLSEDGGNDKLKFGLSSMQGWRATMEDAVSFYLSIIIARFDLFVLFSPFTYGNPQNVPKAKMKFIELLLKDSLCLNLETWSELTKFGYGWYALLSITEREVRRLF
jgi:hypothetical protein